MAEVLCRGPIGVMLALSTVDGLIHGVSAKEHRNGRQSSIGAESYSICYYLKGKRVSRHEALKVLEKHIDSEEEIKIVGRLRN